MYSDNKKREVGFTCLLKARNYAKINDWPRAFPHYLLCLELFENDQSKFEHEFAQALYQLGIWLESNNKLTDICKWYTKGLEYFPSNANILNNFAEHLLRIEEPQTALMYLETAHEIDRNSLVIEKNLTTAKLNIIPRWHYRMLNDLKRNQAFQNAIVKITVPGHKKVLDIGTGCGLLSFYASQCENVEITAVESVNALSTIAKTILPNVNVLNKHSISLDVNDVKLHNVLITEIFDAGLFGEYALETLIHAWNNLLEDSAKTIPHSADVFVTGFNCAELLQRHKLNTDSVLKLNNVCVTQRLKEPYEAENLKLRELIYITNTYKACTVYFNDVEQLKNIYTNVNSIPIFSLVCTTQGTIDGFAIWFNLYLDSEGINVITTNPRENNVTCWEQAIIYLDHPITLQTNDEIKLKLTCIHNQLKISVLDPVINCSHCFKVSPEIITYLNDVNVINVCNDFQLSEHLSRNDLNVFDLNPFPVFALTLAKRGYTGQFKCLLKDSADWEFINYVCNCNRVDTFEVVRDGEIAFKVSDLIFLNPICKNGTLDDCVFQRFEHLLRPNITAIFPRQLLMHIEVIESEYLKIWHKVSDSNLCGFVVADQMNKYSVYEHWEIEPKNFCHKRLGSFDLEADFLRNDINTSICVKVTEGCVANGVLYWFTMDYNTPDHLNTYNSLHYNSACFMFLEPKYLSSDELMLTEIMEIKEFNIPVPWGHVAVKAWGNEAHTPVLVIHGLSDNAGSFDRLIPHLPISYYYICIDLPSHGKSSPYPPHLLITVLDNILTMKLILDYLDRKKYILMGHSWGGQCSILFTQLFPEYILKLIALDCFYLFPIEIRNFKETIRSRIEDLIRINQKIASKQQPNFTYEEAINKMIDNRFVGMTLYKEAAEPIANRSLVQDGEGRYKFITDPRLKSFTNLLVGNEYITKLVRKYPLTCPVLLIYTTDSEFQYFFFKSIVDEYEKNKNCTIVQVTGSHDVHNNNPDVVGPIVSKFLNTIISKL